jgi:membrane associated rhomboid family serine protease
MGLGTRLRRFPAVTLLVCLVWTIVAALDRSDDRITTGLYAAVAKSGVRDAARTLFLQYCSSRRGRPADCAKYQVLVWTGFPKKGRRPGLKTIRSGDLHALSKELGQADKAREELSDCGHRRRCFDNKDIVWSFLDLEKRHVQAFAGLGAYRAYADAARLYRSELKRLCATNLCLVKGNITVPSLLAAQARHGGLWHLLGNMAVFVVFCVYVEQRTSRLLVLFVTVLGGTIGMAVHTAFFGGGDTVSLGGSANVSAVLGMFYVFFYHARMRLAVWLPLLWEPGFGWRRFFADIKWVFPLLFVLTDVAGGLDNGFADLAPEKVAHVAHLTGFAIGALAALAIARWRPVPRPLIYESELRELRALQLTPDLSRQLRRAEQMLAVNPDNVQAVAIAGAAAARHLAGGSGTDPAVARRSRSFLAENLQKICAAEARQSGGPLGYASRLLAALPLDLPFRVVLGRLGQGSTLALADRALGRGEILLALRLYDAFLARFPLAASGRAIEATCAGVLARLAPSPSNAQVISAYLGHHADGPLAPQLGAWLAAAHLGRLA